MVRMNRNIQLNLGGTLGDEQVIIDGQDVTRSVMALTLRQRVGDIPVLELECLGVGETTVEGEARFLAYASGIFATGESVREAVRNLADLLDAGAK